MAENGPKKNAAIEWLRGLVSQIPESPNTLSILNMLRAGSNTALNWLDATNRAIQGYDPRGALEQGDLLAPLGVGAMVAPFSPKNAVGIFGGRLAKTADHAALARAEEMAAKGASREDIWRETGWFKGVDGKWRFEIDDIDAKISDDVAREFDSRAVGDQIPVRHADRFMDHPELFEAYPDLWRVNTRLTKGGGYPYQPSGKYFVRESGTEGIDLDANTLGRAVSMNLHELQHAIQRREGFASGADAKAMGMEDYRRHAGEEEAYNVQRRRLMNKDERRKVPPWETQAIPDEDQIVRLLADQARSSLPGTVINAMAEPQGIRAYHGSPHDFDRFDMSKIGTGEGAQAYGRGLYFAEAEDVAKQYRDQLGWAQNAMRIGDRGYTFRDAEKLAADYDIPVSTAYEVLAPFGPGRGDESPIEFLQARLDNPLGDPARKSATKAALEFHKKHAPETGGRLYEVRINANPDEFLDWDKPLSQQPQRIQEVLRENATEDFLQVAEAVGPGRASQLASMKGGRGWMEDVLREAGIPGIKYLDQGSRAAGEGSRNYVLFRDDIIDIIKKYGIAAAIATYGLEAVQGVLADMDQGFATGGAVGTGPLISDVPGRTDKHPIDVPEGAYVIPADIVSGLGEGNTLAGMRILENLFPKPLKAGKIRRHSEIPAPRNRGGLVPIAAAGGEYIIDPETVAEIGGGDINRGHQVLDEFVLRARKNIIQQMASLPPPQK